MAYGKKLTLRDLIRKEKELMRKSIEIDPPTLKMVVVNPEEEKPIKRNIWTMLINIEPKNPAFNS